jgi:hypothetical protein
MIRTNAEIEKIKPTEKIQKFNLEKGLYLEVTPRGTKVFRIQLSRSNIKPFKVLITLGRYPDIIIKETRSVSDSYQSKKRAQKHQLAA